MDIYKKYGLRKVINASGKMTILGVSKVNDAVILAQDIAGKNFFEMDDLIKKTGEYLSNLLNVENTTIVSSASAGIVQTVGAIIGSGSKYHLMHPYTNKIAKREIIIPKGHNVNYGTSVEIMIEQGGGIVVEAGYANECTYEELEVEINENTAGIIYVKSHHAVQKSILGIEDAIKISKKYKLPLIVDAAAEEDLVKYYNLGADIVIYSGAKAIEGPSSGLIIGRNPYIDWIRLQAKGIGRSMKIGKDNILALSESVENYMKNAPESGNNMKKRLSPFINDLNNIEGINAEIIQDVAGRDIYRAKVKVSSKYITAKQLVNELKIGDIAVYTRDYDVNNGVIEFDIRSVNKEEMDFIVEKLNNILMKRGQNG